MERVRRMFAHEEIQGLKSMWQPIMAWIPESLRENSPCVVPSGLDLREILPGTPVPGYRLSRPFGTYWLG
jgi:hypothetical protein